MDERPALHVLALYSLSQFWSMGEGKGASAFTRTLQALTRRGHRVTVSLPAEAGAPAEIGEFSGCRLVRAVSGRRFLPDPHLAAPMRLWDRWRCWRDYQRWATEQGISIGSEDRPDLVLALGVFEAAAAYRVARQLDTANVTRLFGNNLSLNLHDPIRFYANFPEVIAFRTPCDLLILTNDGAHGEQLAKRLGVAPARFRYLRNGLEFERFTPGEPDPALRARLGIPVDAPLLITVTRLAEEKKLERAVGLMPALAKRHPEARLVLLGEGPERPRLEQLARDLHVADRVLMPGAIHQDELPDWYRSADLLLSLLDRTNASNPVFEAMACGRVVVALDTGTTRDVVVDGVTGLLVRRGEIARLGEQIASLFDDRSRRIEMQQAAVRHIRSLLVTPRERLDQEVDLLEEVVAARRRANEARR